LTRFGVFVPQGWRRDLIGIPVEEQWATMLGVARRLEAAGYESAWVYDHFHTIPLPTQESTFECWALMAALAATTDRVRLGQMCTCHSYRPPSYLAKVAASVDVISGGRLDLGIGAGWYEHEYLAYGYEYPKGSVRIAQLAEAVQVIKAMWTQDEASFEGRHYRVSGAINRPRPLQVPHPPLWIAGGGEQRTLRVVAEHADYANFAGDAELFARKSRILDQHCEAIGRDPASIGRTCHLVVMVDPDAGAIERAAAQGMRTAQQWLALPQMVVGTAGEVLDHLAGFRDAGCTYFIMYMPDAVWGDSIEKFTTEVAPQLG
jgi:F420-dependent oxidoreductase-like protein